MQPSASTKQVSFIAKLFLGTSVPYFTSPLMPLSQLVKYSLGLACKRVSNPLDHVARQCRRHYTHILKPPLHILSIIFTFEDWSDFLPVPLLQFAVDGVDGVVGVDCLEGSRVLTSSENLLRLEEK